MIHPCYLESPSSFADSSDIAFRNQRMGRLTSYEEGQLQDWKNKAQIFRDNWTDAMPLSLGLRNV